MCALVIWIPGGAEPLVLAANRDEKLDRPSLGPLLWSGAPPLVAPRDEVAGGSWWAVGPRGLVAAVTNRAGAFLESTRRSRGLLVLELARSESLDAAHRQLSALEPSRYNGFHALVATRAGAVRAVCDGREIRVDRLGAGMHVVTERSFGAMVPSRDEEVRQAFAAVTHPGEPCELGRLLATHADDPLRSVCVHLPEFGYGTRSASVIVLAAEPRDSALWHGEGPPCRAPLEDRSALLRALLTAG